MPVGQKEPNNWQAEMAAAARRLITAAQRTPQAVRFPSQKAADLVYELIQAQGALLSPKELQQLAQLPRAKRPASVSNALSLLNREGEKARCLVCEASGRHPLLSFQLPIVAVEKIWGMQDAPQDPFYDLPSPSIPSCPQGLRPSGSIRRNHQVMDMNQQNIEAIIKQVLTEMKGEAVKPAAVSAAPKAAASNALPKTSRVAMLTALEHYDIKEYPIPEIGDDEILVKVEGCGVCGTDAHEFKRDPFGLIPVVLGHEGTGEIVKLGKNVKKDSAGKELAVGDKVVTCMIFKDNPDITMFDLNKQNVGGADVYGLLPDDDKHLNGWFADYLVIRGGSSVFNVSDLDLDSRILIEPCAVLIHAVERAKTTGILRFNSRVVVQGCGPIGLICIAVLRTMGIENIVAVDGETKRLDFAKKMGADRSVNFMEHKGVDALSEAVQDAFGGHMADFAFQCTGSPVAHSNIYKFIRNGGGLCELGFFINGGDATINPHFDLCSKEITLVGSWVYTLRDYATTFDFLKRAKAIGLPMSDLITHRFPLEKINEAHITNLNKEGLKIAIVNQ